MNESNQNFEREKQEKLKEIIKELHEGVAAEKLQKKFRNIIKDTLPEEIADMENALIQEGFPPEEIQKLCDVHAQVFEKALAKVGKPRKIPGHPIHTFIQENKETKKILKRLLRQGKKIVKTKPAVTDISDFESEFNRFKEIEKHYLRKENQLFPVLEEKKFMGPSKVMWGKHDEIREEIKRIDILLKNKEWEGLYVQIKKVSSAIKKMIFLEEKILYPTSARKLSTLDWANIEKGEAEIGYAWITPSNLWDAELAKSLEPSLKVSAPALEKRKTEEGKIRLEEGALTREQLTLLLKNLPVDITFVDEKDKICFYSANKDRIFPRSPAVIGREVQNCHPPKSVNVVNQIVQSFKEKSRDVAEFWIQKDNQFIYIRYFPVYNDRGDYKGVVEVSQDVACIRSLKGERRLLDW
jgi:DUF438 domain-containing protein